MHSGVNQQHPVAGEKWLAVAYVLLASPSSPDDSCPWLAINHDEAQLVPAALADV